MHTTSPVERDSDSIYPSTSENPSRLENAQPRTPLVELMAGGEVDGVSVTKVAIDDLYFPTSPELQQARDEIQSHITSLEIGLRSDDQSIVREATVSGRAMLDSSQTIKEWKKWMKTAMALYPLQRPDAQTMLDGTPVDSFAKKLFLYGQDAIGIRSRGAIFSHLLSSRDGAVEDIISLACGAAVPECDAIAAMQHKPRAVFVDIDEKALDHIDSIASETAMGGEYERILVDLVRGFMLAKQPHPQMSEASFDIVDALGITEYFSDRHAERFLKKAYGLVRPGGALIFGNMLDTHPTLKFQQHVVEWPDVVPRSQEKLANIAGDIAGAGNVEMYIPTDGVYAVLELKKPTFSNVRSLGRNALVA